MYKIYNICTKSTTSACRSTGIVTHTACCPPIHARIADHSLQPSSPSTVSFAVSHTVSFSVSCSVSCSVSYSVRYSEVVERHHAVAVCFFASLLASLSIRCWLLYSNPLSSSYNSS